MAKYTFAKLLAQASSDENRTATGGASGDNVGVELNATSYYTTKGRPWRKVYRFNDAEIANRIADWMVDAVLNGNVGYDNSNRNSLFNAFAGVATNWDVSTLNVDCETDCSALIYTCLYNVTRIAWDSENDPDAEGGALPTCQNYDYYINQLINAGYDISVFDTPAYLTSADNLVRGDIIRSIVHGENSYTGGRHVVMYV